MRAIGLLGMLAVFGASLGGCAAARQNKLDLMSDPLDVVIVPGCPSADDGTLSGCQWSRVVWAAELYDRGKVKHFITSGSAVYNPYVEAEALKAGLVELGVPEELIWLEMNALHTDENAAYSYLIVEEQGWTRIGVASHKGHAAWMDKLIEVWMKRKVMTLGMDEDLIYARLADGMPVVRTEPIDNWVPMKDRERAIANSTGKRRRGSSGWKYFRFALAPGLSKPPALPPEHMRVVR